MNFKVNRQSSEEYFQRVLELLDTQFVKKINEKGERKHVDQKEKKHILTFSFLGLLKEIRMLGDSKISSFCFWC